MNYYERLPYIRIKMSKIVRFASHYDIWAWITQNVMQWEV